MIDWLTSAHRIGSYWLISALLFFWFAWLAIRRLIEEPTRMRVAILAFAASWGLLCANNGLFRFGFIAGAGASLSSWEAETIRAACVASLGWLCWEFRARRAERTGRMLTDGER